MNDDRHPCEVVRGFNIADKGLNADLDEFKFTIVPDGIFTKTVQRYPCQSSTYFHKSLDIFFPIADSLSMTERCHCRVSAKFVILNLSGTPNNVLSFETPRVAAEKWLSNLGTGGIFDGENTA